MLAAVLKQAPLNAFPLELRAQFRKGRGIRITPGTAKGVLRFALIAFGPCVQFRMFLPVAFPFPEPLPETFAAVRALRNRHTAHAEIAPDFPHTPTPTPQRKITRDIVRLDPFPRLFIRPQSA